MIEADWHTCANPTPMVRLFQRTPNARKLRSFACACCRQVWDAHLTDIHRASILVAERHADGEASDAELGVAVSAVHRTRRAHRAIDLAVHYAVRCRPGERYYGAERVARDVARVVAHGERSVYEVSAPDADRLIRDAAHVQAQRSQADLLRDIVGDPPWPHSGIAPELRTETVVGLATAIYQLRAYDRLPVLADALEEAGCDDEALLGHCRGPGPHARGCWALDAVLGRHGGHLVGSFPASGGC